VSPGSERGGRVRPALAPRKPRVVGGCRGFRGNIPAEKLLGVANDGSVLGGGGRRGHPNRKEPEP
jgi:hypothetical protein